MPLLSLGGGGRFGPPLNTPLSTTNSGAPDERSAHGGTWFWINRSGIGLRGSGCGSDLVSSKPICMRSAVSLRAKKRPEQWFTLALVRPPLLQTTLHFAGCSLSKVAAQEGVAVVESAGSDDVASDVSATSSISRLRTWRRTCTDVEAAGLQAFATLLACLSNLS